MWAASAASTECSAPRSAPTNNVSAVVFSDDGSYYVALLASVPDVDVCPQMTTTASCSCASTCPCRNVQGRLTSLGDCDCRRRCDPSIVDFIVNFCPERKKHWPTSSGPVKRTSTQKVTVATANQTPQNSYTDKVTTSTANPSPHVLSPTERHCACHPEKLWLDIMVALDNSASMGLDGLVKITVGLSTVFTGFSFVQELVQTSRIALISYSANGKILGNLTTYSNNDQFTAALFFVEPSSDKQVNVVDALKKTDVVRNAVSQSKTRQTVIVLTASAYNSEGASDPGPYATQIRQSGVKILTIAFIRENERDEEVRKISDLASPGFSFTVSAVHSAPSDLILQAFCRANCFCPNGWFQVSDDFQKPFIKYAECVRLSTNSSNWNMGKTACASEVNDNAFLASERSEAKHKFHADYIRSIVGKVQPYFIGLSWHTESRQYLWSEEYDDGTPIPLDPNGYQAWASGNGHHRKTPAGVLVVPLGLTGTYWYDVDTYRTLGACMCQVNACDSHNYCDDSVDHDN